MHAHAQRFVHYHATGGTPLRSATWINLNTDSTGSFRLVLGVRDQVTPGGIRNAFRQRGMLDHARDVQILKYNHPKLIDQTATEFVSKVRATVRNPLVYPAHNPLVILAFRRTLGVLAHASLRPCQRLLILTEKARVRDLLARGQGGKVGQPDVDAYSMASMWLLCRITKVARHDQIPVVGAPRKGQRFDRAVNRTVQHDSDIPDVLEVHTVAYDLAPVAVAWVLDCIKAIASLVPRVAGVVTSLDAAKERIKGFFEAAQRRLTTGEVRLRQVGIGRAIYLQLCRLIFVPDAPVFLLPGIFAFSKRSIVQVPMGIQHLEHRTRLLTRRVQAIAERRTHTTTIRVACGSYGHMQGEEKEHRQFPR